MTHNILTISIYGKGREKIYSELGQFNPSYFSKAPFYKMSYGWDEDSVTKRIALMQYLLRKKQEISDLFFNFCFEEYLVLSQEDEKQIEKGEGEYFLFSPMVGLIVFVPVDFSTICSTYFSTPAQKYVNIPRTVKGTYSYFNFDFDGALYIHHSLARILKQNDLAGITFYPVISNDEDFYTYEFRKIEEEGRMSPEKVAEIVGCTFNPKSELFSLTREDVKNGKKKLLYDTLLTKRPGQNGIKEEQEDCEDEEPDFDSDIKEFTPSPDSEYTKWMTVDIPLMKSIESEKTIFSSDNRTCPHCGKVYPYLVSQMHLKRENIPSDLDFFRTESNHIIISKKVLDVFRTQGKGLVRLSKCEPVILEEEKKKEKKFWQFGK